MSPKSTLQARARRCAPALLLALLLSACGGGDGGGGDLPAQPASCSVADQQTWLEQFMDTWYFWYALRPDPDPAGFGSVAAYFDALRYRGGTDPFPADRWSFQQSTASFDQFFGNGQTLGYGLLVAGLEVEGRPDQPLRVRFVEPGSPAAAGGLQRGDTIVSVNGQAAGTLIGSGDFSVLTPTAAGDRLALVVRRAGTADRSPSLVAAVYTLTPVTAARVLTTPQGTRVGYLVLKDFIAQARTPLATAFTEFKAAGVRELVLDLRYNGGGLVSVAGELASYVAGPAEDGRPFVTLKYSDRQPAADTTAPFVARAQSLGLDRVYVIAGERTCSASELVINGLRPFVEVVQIGGATCGKPVGFLPRDACGTTYNAVTFESVNAQGQGRYWDGLAPTCAVAEDFARPLGEADELLTAAALSHADTGVCPAIGASREGAQRQRHRVLRGGPVPEPAEPRGMFLPR